MKVQVLVAQSRLPLCNPMNYSPPGSYVHGILQARYWSGLPFPSPRNHPNPGIEPMFLMSPALTGGFFTTSATWEAPEYNVRSAKPQSVGALGVGSN